MSLVRLLEIIGEAAKGITNDFCREHHELPWKSMMGMIDRLIHGYFDVNLDIIWKTVKNDLPPLIEKIEKILSE